jgi:DNA gyrase subunit B
MATPTGTGEFVDPAQDAGSSDYTSKDIQVLEGVEAVRRRPAMYIGDTGVRGLHHLAYELVDNSIDEALAGFCRNITVRIHGDGSITVADDGRGIPVDIHPTEGKPALEVILTKVHAGGKFTHTAYKVSGGLHGVGVTVVNALSEWLEVEVWRDGKVYAQEYERGKPVTPVRVIGTTSKRGTKICFKPDPGIFSDTRFRYDILENRLRELAFLNRGVRIRLIDERDGREQEFCYDGGLVEFVRYLNRTETPLHEDVIHILREAENIRVEVALQYTEGYSERLYSYANTINTVEGGTHVTGFRTGLTKALNAYGRKEKLFGDLVPTGEDFREGLTAVVSVLVPDPQFEGQTKTRLGNSEVESTVASVVYEDLATYLEEHPATARKIIEMGILAAEAREAARKAKELTRRQGALKSAKLPGKLRDCTSEEVDGTELFLVEGQSAGGTADSARDRHFQAILPLRGKILNVEKARLEKVLKNEELASIFQALGVFPGEENRGRRRYGKVILMTDADVDGSHIRTLLLTFFFRQLPQLVAEGCVYIAQPPLYRVRERKKTWYVQTDEEMKEQLLAGGLRDAVLERPDGSRIEGEELRRLVEVLKGLEEPIQALERRGITLAALLERRSPKTGRLPVYRVLYGQEERWFETMQEVEDYVAALKERLGTSVDVSDEEVEAQQEAEDRSSSQAAGVRVSELHEARAINRLLAHLTNAGARVEELLPPEAPIGEEPPPAFYLIKGSQRYPVESLRSLTAVLRQVGEKGLAVTRFKGLGEMNAEELWETTMDPEKRTLLRVSMEDAQAADDLFRVLMGEQVEPRRDFIERHALEAKSLDV